MFIYIKYFILIIFTILLSIEDIKYKNVPIKMFIRMYFFTLLIYFIEIAITCYIAKSFIPIFESIKNLLLPLVICAICFVMCIKKTMPIGEGDIIFIFSLFFYFSHIEVIEILFISLFIVFCVSIIIISSNLILHKGIKNSSLAYIPALLPGIIYIIGVHL